MKQDFFNVFFTYQKLDTIKGIEFTPRESDVIACILNNRGTKKIASILSMAPRTAETHIRNIMSKLGCSSREGIIDFVESSKEFSRIKDHYLDLLIENKFTNALKKISSMVTSEEVCFVDLNYVDDEKVGFVEKLISYLKLTHIKFPKDLERLEGIDKFHGLYPLSEQKLDLFKENIEKKITPVSSAILLMIDDGIELPSFAVKKSLYLRDYDTHYALIFDLLKILLPKVSFEKIVENFNAEAASLRKVSHTNEGGSISIVPGQKGKLWDMKSLPLKGIVACIGISCLIFFGYLLSRGHSPLSERKGVLSFKGSRAESLLTWNLPHVVGHYVERKQLTDRIWDKFTDQNKRETTVLAGLHGLGGIGKTTLAINLIHNPQNRYEFRGWFSAETKDLLKADYFELGNKLHLFSQVMSDRLKIKIVKEWLESKKGVFLVYDNAPDMETVNDYLPNNGHIIITSRNYKFPGAIEVDVMTETEAFSLLDKLIPNKLQKTLHYQKQAKSLIQELGYLPLALSQAGGYINENVLTLSHYLQLYGANKEKLLLEKSLPPGDQHEPVYITWDINTKKIQNLPHGNQALALLDFISYCYPENIPKRLLMQYLYGKITNDTEIEFNKALNLLRQYSLTKISSNVIFIHRLVHNWVKSKHTKEGKLTILKRGVNAIQTIYPGDNKTTEEIEFVKCLIPHAESLLLKIKPLVSDVYIINLILLLGDSYDTLGNYDKSRQFFENALPIHQKHFGNSHIKTARVLRKLGKAHVGLGNFVKAKRLSEKALTIIEKHYSADHMEAAKTLHVLGGVYVWLSNYVKVKQLLGKALAIMEKHFGSDHIETANVLRHLGWAHCCLGDFDMAKQLSEKALAIIEKYYGSDHVKTAEILHDLGWTHIFLGQYVKAQQLLKKTLDIKKKYYGNEHIRVAYVTSSIGLSHCYLGDFVQGKALVNKAYKTIDRLYGQDHVIAAIFYANLGNIYRLLNNTKESKKWSEKAFEVFYKFYGSDNINVAIVRGNLGLLYGDLGDHAKKRDHLEKALKAFKKHLYLDHTYIKATQVELKKMNDSSVENNRNTSRSMGYFIIF